MRNRLDEARALVPEVAAQLFQERRMVQSVGVGLVDGDYGFVVERRTGEHRLLCARAAAPPPLRQFRGFDVRWMEAPRAPSLLNDPTARPRQPEQARVRPLVGGLQVQNLDADLREGVLAHGGYVGTLGCLVRLPDGGAGMLSNAHVLAGCGSGVCGHDRIMQAGGCRAYAAPDHVAVLEAFLPLVPEPAQAAHYEAIPLNVGDAAVARLLPGTKHMAGYLPARGMPVPAGTATPMPGETVYKVGRTTGLTRGVIDRVGLVDYMPYPHGTCWFFDVFSVRSAGEDEFADQGDSGAVVLREDGTVLGLLFASAANGVLCSEIEPLLEGLGCSLM